MAWVDASSHHRSVSESAQEVRTEQLGAHDQFSSCAAGGLVPRSRHQEQLSLADAHELLQQHGYEMVCRVGHVHAAAGRQEWHVCLIVDLASLSSARFLASRNAALKLHGPWRTVAEEVWQRARQQVVHRWLA